MKLLALSNGHGEDIIAGKILKQLQQQPNPPSIVALPLVGIGYTYTQLKIPIIGPAQKMPSGGFVYMDSNQLWGDLKAGLLQLTLAQYQAIRKWAKTGGKILAVGDIVPLLFAWLSGLNYVFVGTAKSEYYLRDESGWLPQTKKIEKIMGSVYFPHERCLLRNKRCKGVIPRDSLTCKILQQYSIPALDLGNPMMDEVYEDRTILINRNANEEENRVLTVLLLPGSRAPEAQRNWERIILAAQALMDAYLKSIIFIGAISPNLNLQSFVTPLEDNWHHTDLNNTDLNLQTCPIKDSQALYFSQKQALIVLTQSSYQKSLLAADLAISMAGTATEQFVGTGKPAVAIVGDGPQFTPRFAEAQTRLLGRSLTLVNRPEDVGKKILSILSNPDLLQFIAKNGKRRMGKPGAAERIANYLSTEII